MKKRLILLMAAAALTGAKAEAQTAVASAGGEAGTMSFTVGQPFVAPATSNAGSIAPGVQQAYNITVVDGIENKQITLEADVYPNPVSDLLTLKVGNTSDEANLRYTLTDASGRTITSKKFTGPQTVVDMNDLVQAVYFLRINDGETALKTFKIVKK